MNTLPFVLTFVLVILQALQLIYSQSENRCSNIKEDTCWYCIQEPGCAWCSQDSYNSRRCDIISKLQKTCHSNHTVFPKPEKEPDPDHEDVGENNQLSPRKVNLTLRVGEKFSFKVNVRPAENYPVDLYYLMDLSKSMADDLENLKVLAGNISKKLNELTSRHRLAFGSYVDKVIMPYVKKKDIGNAYCYTDDITGKTPCGDVPYDFKHILNFTADSAKFKRKITATTFSGNRDVPEGMLDALMQIATCEEELDWGPKITTRRMVLVATDAPFHIAGEGKFGGIVTPNDEKCHLQHEGNVRTYSKDLELDYPSPNQVFRKLQEANIQPIFATGAIRDYSSLADAWSELSATFGILDDKSGNITKLIEESYRKIVSTVRVTPLQTPDNVKLDITPDCSGSSKATSVQNACKGVGLGETISFDVGVTVDTCEAGNTTSFKLLFTGIGEVEVNVNIICTCDCQSVEVPQSPKCTGNGTLICGSCVCDQGRSGQKCQCDSSLVIDERKTDTCKRVNTSDIICEDNGDCSCGECQCKLIPNTNERYYGKYCQCSDFNCEQYENKLCGGESRGKCECGKCKCNTGFTGSNCGEIDCSLEIDNCLINGVNCSNNGECICGICKCKPFYERKHCDSCPSCAGRCDDFKRCVQCEVFGYVPANKTECEDCPFVETLDTFAEIEQLGFPAVCIYTDEDGCKYRFTYGTTKGKNVTIYAATEKDCPEGPDVLLIVLAVIGGIVGIGILLLILWKLLTAMVDRREYEKFERDRAKSKWHREKNPLYQPATSTVQNPTFVGSRT